MIKYKDPMLDSTFLEQLAMERERELYAKVIALDLDENPIEEIQGRVTQGSVPVDGNSIVRRTCSLTLVAHEMNINDYIWGLETKIKLFIGVSNKINSQYPPIIWFKMGTFVLTSFSSSISASGHTVSLQGKDKMCLLNGDIGGSLTALSYDFGTVKVINKSGYTYTEQIPIKTIIQKAVHEYAKEPFHNIIINDLEDCGLELIEYRGDDPLYFVYNVNTQEVANMVLNQQQIYYIKGFGELSIADIEYQNQLDILEDKTPTFIFKTLTDDIDLTVEKIPTEFFGLADGDGNRQGPYNLIKIEKGMTCGYRTCELVYAGKLTASAGEPITGVLTKIVNMLGNYEYFYNLDGQFVFQRKRTYVNTSWNNMVNNGEEDWVENSAYTSSFLFSFEDGTLITSYQNAPNLANLKNDFSIWGARTGVSGAQIPIHLRYAIDKKPTYYTAIDGTTYTTRTEEEVEWDKENLEHDLPKGGYQKEPSRFGLSEDWWEVRDWAKAWLFSGLSIPTSALGTYCPIRCIVYKEGDGDKVNIPTNYERVEVPLEVWEQWGPGLRSGTATDDLIFKADGTFHSYHGGCVHPYDWWLAAFEEGGQYGPDCYAYFYKPQIPQDEITNGGAGLIIGDKIVYSCDWRELIYRMAIDYKNYADKDPTTDPEKMEDDVNRDNFLMKVREWNPSFYPDGYTGYEQYYTDMEGFWRQLYDPDYTTSYDIISLSKRKYTEEGRLGEFYYDAPIYTQCQSDDPYYSGVLYYVLKNNEYEPCTGLLQTEYGKNPSKYWMITDTEIQPVPLITEPFISGADKYWKRAANGYTKVENVNSRTYESLAPDLYLRISDYSYFPCVTIKDWVSGKLYFTQQEDGSFKPDTTVKEDTYLASPGKYYERAVVGGQIKFSNCTIIQEFSTAREYYERKTAQDGTFYYERVYLNEKSYNDLGTANTYYYAVINYSYTPCIHPKYEYDVNCNYYKEGLKEYELDPNSPNLYWNKLVQDSPESLNFWFDFLDTYGELSQYSVSSVGDRPKAVNDTNVKAIYFRETPGVIFVENLNDITEKKSGYTYAQLPQHLEYLFSISGQCKSAKDVLDNFLYTHSYCVESITINAIPVYHLEPNTRIFVRDDRCGINGEYIVTRINYPLAASGTMSINATKVVDRIY